MKHKLQYIVLAVFCLAAFSCKKDNVEEPKSKLSGRFHYKGEAIHAQYDQVPFLLFESGFGKVGPVGANSDPRNPTNSLGSQSPALTQEGTYSHVLFDGEYKLLVAPGQGPFYWPQTGGRSDSISITVRGDTQMNIEVEPYYMIRTPQISKSGGNVTAAFKIEKIITDAARAKDVEMVSLFINKTQFVSGNDNIGRTEIAGGAIADPNNVSMSVAVPAISPAQSYVFARIGVKMAGVEDWIFSPVQKIEL